MSIRPTGTAYYIQNMDSEVSALMLSIEIQSRVWVPDHTIVICVQSNLKEVFAVVENVL